MNSTPHASEMVDITSIDTLAALVLAWHTDKLATLNHLISIPTGTEVAFDEQAPIILEGDLLRGFVAGIQFALLDLNDLPFSSTKDDKSDAQSESLQVEPA